MSNLNYVQSPTFYQAGSGSIAGSNTITVPTLTDIYGNVLTMASFGAKGYGTCEPDTNNEEAFTFTGITANPNTTFTFTGVQTALAQTPYTETSGLIRQHSGGTKIVITDNVAFWNTFGNKQNNETITGSWTVPTPTTSTQIANKGYVDGVAIAGGANASSTVKGISYLDTNPVSPTSPIAVGVNSALLTTLSGTVTSISNKIVDSSSLKTIKTNNGVVQAGATGFIDGSFASNTANGLVSLNGSGQLPAVSGALLTNVPGILYTNGFLAKDASVSTTTTIAHGLGKTPLNARLSFSITGIASSGVQLTAYCVFNGTTQTAYSVYTTGASTTSSSASLILSGSFSGWGTLTGTVTFDATNIYITWVKSSTPQGSYNLIWEAVA